MRRTNAKGREAAREAEDTDKRYITISDRI